MNSPLVFQHPICLIYPWWVYWLAQDLEAKLNELRAAHRIELAELVRVSNKKYNDLLAEKLNREDELTAEAALHQKDVEALTTQVKQLKVHDARAALFNHVNGGVACRFVCECVCCLFVWIVTLHANACVGWCFKSR
jgi:hypothetical protein